MSCDWVVDDLPSWMRTAHGPLVAMPYNVEINDSIIYAIERHATGEMEKRLRHTLDLFAREADADCRVLAIGLHPHLISVPHRMHELVGMIDALQAHPGRPVHHRLGAVRLVHRRLAATLQPLSRIMDLGLSGRTALITGGSKGIGLAAARAFLAEGARVVLVARDADRLAEAARALGRVDVVTHEADLAQGAAREALATRFPEIDNPRQQCRRHSGRRARHHRHGDLGARLGAQVMGYIHLTQLYLGRMRQRGSGVIVNVIGSAGRSPRHDYVCGATATRR